MRCTVKHQILVTQPERQRDAVGGTQPRNGTHGCEAQIISNRRHRFSIAAAGDIVEVSRATLTVPALERFDG
jgi:hypothetical protein